MSQLAVPFSRREEASRDEASRDESKPDYPTGQEGYPVAWLHVT